MARISTYIKDTGLTDRDLLVGSNEISGVVGQEVYETANFSLKGIKEFVAEYILGNKEGVYYITENVQLDGSTAKKVKICSFPTGTTIIDGSFRDSEFTSITLPSGLITIEDLAFEYNYLTSVTIPDTVTSIGLSAFGYNTSLTTVNIPSGVTNIGNSAFIQTDLTFTDLTIPASCAVGSDAFNGSEVTGTLTIGNSASLNTRCFNATLNNVVIGDNVSAPGPENTNGPFVGAVINGTVTMGDNIDFGDMYWFNYMSGTATSVSFGPNFSNSNGAFFRATFDSYTFTGNPANTIPDGATLGTFMFEQSGITSVTIGDNVTIGAQAFDQCLDIASLTLGDNVTMIYDPSYNGLQFSSIAQNISGGIPVTIPGTTTLAANSFANANISTLTIESGLTEIPVYCFNGNTITSLSIPSTVLTFGDYCFYNQSLSGLATLTLGSSGNPITVGNYAFAHLTSVTTVNIPTGSTLGTNAFGSATVNYY